MAERGDRPSIQDGSDADFAFTCTPCSEEGTREEAIKYCPECDEYLCSTCTRYHLKMKTTRDHKLEEGKDASKAESRTTKIKCQQHPDRDIEMYCGTHDMVYCLMCIATEHRSCSDVTSLADATGSNFQQDEIDRLHEESETIAKLLVASENSKQENLVMVEGIKTEIQRRVREIEDGMIQHIKNLSEEAETSLNQTYSKVKCELESEIAILSRSRSEVEKVKKLIQSTTEEDQEHRFVQVKLCQKVLNDAKNQHTKFESDGKITIDFEENRRETGRLLDLGYFGKIKDARVNRKREIKHQKEVNVRMQNDKTTCRIIDVCQLDSGDFVLADTTNKKLKLMDTNLKVTKYFTVDGVPSGVCRSGHKEVAVKLSTENIELFSVDTHICKLKSISIKEGGRYWGITYTTGKFWVSTGTSVVDVYYEKGTFEKSVVNDTAGQKVFKSSLRQMSSSDKSVFVADFNNGIDCLGNDGSKKAEFRDSRLTYTVGVCVSNDDTVFALDSQSKKIVIFSHNEKCLGVLEPEVPSTKNPESLCYDNRNNCILIGFNNSDSITVLYLSD